MSNLSRTAADTALRNRAGITLDTAVRRITRTLESARPADISAGTTWYDTARGVAADISAASGVDLETVAAVISHLSPRTTWSRNVSAAWHVCLGLEGDPRGCIGRNVSAARKALNTADGAAALATLNGPKVKAFAAAILGDPDAVVVDVWAARVALDPTWTRGADTDTDKVLGRKDVYAAVQVAYRIAARRYGVDATAGQAIAWVVVRNGRAY